MVCYTDATTLSPWDSCTTDLKLYEDPWKLKKVLTATDVSPHQNRLLLPSDSVQSLVFPVLTNDEISKLDSGVVIHFYDIDSDGISDQKKNSDGIDSSLKMKRWASNGSYVLIGNWNDDFIKRRNLKEGDEIGFQWDKYNQRFNFSVLTNYLANKV